jgi:hypothetical protein
MPHSTETNLITEYLREYEFMLEMAFAHESEDRGYCLPEKTECQKSCETVPLKDFNKHLGQGLRPEIGPLLFYNLPPL